MTDSVKSIPTELFRRSLIRSLILTELTSQVAVTEVLGGGCFYVQSVGDQKLASIQNHLASMCVKDAPILASFNPRITNLHILQMMVKLTAKPKCKPSDGGPRNNQSISQASSSTSGPVLCRLD
ncbi:hypothetical protein Bca101_027422 [Brassica carinata]